MSSRSLLTAREHSLVGEVFKYFDEDGDGAWDFEEACTAVAATEDRELATAEYHALCESVGADPAVGLLPEHIAATYELEPHALERDLAYVRERTSRASTLVPTLSRASTGLRLGTPAVPTTPSAAAARWPLQPPGPPSRPKSPQSPLGAADCYSSGGEEVSPPPPEARRPAAGPAAPPGLPPEAPDHPAPQPPPQPPEPPPLEPPVALESFYSCRTATDSVLMHTAAASRPGGSSVRAAPRRSSTRPISPSPVPPGPRGFLGIEVAERRAGDGGPPLVEVHGVPQGGAAWRHGLRAGDVITHYRRESSSRADAVAATSAESFAAFAAATAPGEAVALSVLRGEPPAALELVVAADAVPAAVPLVTSLAVLSDLSARGELSPERFAEAKRRLLFGRLPPPASPAAQCSASPAPPRDRGVVSPPRWLPAAATAAQRRPASPQATEEDWGEVVGAAVASALQLGASPAQAAAAAVAALRQQAPRLGLDVGPSPRCSPSPAAPRAAGRCSSAPVASARHSPAPAQHRAAPHRPPSPAGVPWPAAWRGQGRPPAATLPPRAMMTPPASPRPRSRMPPLPIPPTTTLNALSPLPEGPGHAFPHRRL
eukprot:TRINITY_DN60884_c0_g1_i1.p1 TRINITY_DN60884_c0_g1~~TRINITY_DN60884_c0_g1_i1.p1  ORF type:complete len:629 (+),score=109.29 TRINITY_DN60884_c0_g1_i1:87-1889(+)